MTLRLGERTLSLDRCRIMGILNTTPDSFSDGGKFSNIADALSHAETMANEGADIIDVGGESTRPGAAPISAQEEIDRTIPLVEKICLNLDIAVSIDTSKPDVMLAAARAGASLVNDVFALQQEGALAAAASLNVAICLMHMQGKPATMQDNPGYAELPDDVIRFLEQRIRCCVEGGIVRERLVVDPGFGFGKNDRHNLQILAELEQFTALGVPILVGLSRKGTLGNLTGRPAAERLFAGVAAAVLAADRGARIIRTHDVAATVDALRIADAVRDAGSEK